jgi:hypothetical protein
VVPLNGSGLGFPFEGAALPEEWENGPYCFDDGGNGRSLHAPAVPTNQPLDVLENISQCLVFWASTSSNFRLGEAIIQQSDRRWNATEAPRRYSLVDADFDIVGNVLLDGTDDEWMDRGRHGFIQIAEAHYFGLDDEAKDIEDCPLYLVMLVEWDEQLNVAYRLGLGRVRKTAWMLAGPKLKLVCLG